MMNIILLLGLMVAEVFGTKVNPLSDEFINYINSKQSTWIAGRNFDENTPIEELRKLLGALRTDPSIKAARRVTFHQYSDIPESFDAREQWPECKDVIGQIADQSNCGSCWAVSVASAMTDRRCIHSQGKLKVPISALDIISCMDFDGCIGGFPDVAWTYWHSDGFVTGGLYNSSQGCKPYSMQPCEHHINGTRIPCSQLHYDTPECSKKCDDESLNYKDELTFAANGGGWFEGEKDIQQEILTSGTVTITFDVYEDIYSYKSGVYQHTAGKYVASHAVRVIGWGVENEIPYWLIANSWNEDWGSNGYVKILRGKNEVGCESEGSAALPKV